MTNEKRTVKVTIQIPRGVLDFLDDLLRFSNLDTTGLQVIEREVTKLPAQLLSSLEGEWIHPGNLLEKYGLETS